MINTGTLLIQNLTTYEMCGRYLRTQFTDNKDRFVKRFIEPLSTFLTMNSVENHKDVIKLYMKLWDISKPYTYSEAFGITNAEARATVFSVINVDEMVNNLGTTRIKTSGIDLVNRTYNTVTGTHEDNEFTQIYELHQVNGSKLGLSTNELYAIKCWCTSTDQVHWLWTSAEMGRTGDPLAAIADCCKYYVGMQGKITHIIRQGDVFLFEMSEPYIPTADEEVCSSTKDEYFKLLKSQS
jgi:hypothetical protein